MKLYTFDSAPNPARLKMFIDYKGITVDTQQIDMAKAAQLDGSYTDIVPEATLPTLVLDDGTRLTEVIAIAHYLEAVYPERPLLGTTPSERGLILNWNHRIFNTLFMACAEAFRNSHPAYAGRALPGPQNFEQIPALAERGKARLMSALEMTNRRPSHHMKYSTPELSQAVFSRKRSEGFFFSVLGECEGRSSAREAAPFCAVPCRSVPGSADRS